MLIAAASLAFAGCEAGPVKPYSMAAEWGARCRANCKAMGLDLFEVSIGPAQSSDRCICRPGAADGGAR